MNFVRFTGAEIEEVPRIGEEFTEPLRASEDAAQRLEFIGVEWNQA